MKKKLTLTVETSAIRRLKSMAASQRTSVSGLLEEWSMRSAPPQRGALLGERLHARWAADPAIAGDPRLEFLLRKHTT